MTDDEAYALAAQLAARIQADVHRAGLGERARTQTVGPGVAPSTTPLPMTGDESEGDISLESSAPRDAAVTVFVSWAHRGESWTDKEAQDWERTVAEFATVLRQLGIESDVDLYHLDEAGVDWTRFGQQAIVSSDFVLIAISAAWAERWAGTNSPRVGAGAAAEADMLKGLFQRDQAAFQRRTQIVVLPGRSPAEIPPDLSRLVHHLVDPSDADSVLPLIRSLTGQPRYPVPPLGTVPTLPPTMRVGSADAEEVDEFGELLSAVEELRQRLKSARGVRRAEVAQKIAALEGILDAISQA